MSFLIPYLFKIIRDSSNNEFQTWHFPKFYQSLIRKDSPFFIDSIRYVKKLSGGLELRTKIKDLDRIYFLALPEYSNIKGLQSMINFYDSDFLSFYTKNKRYLDKFSDYSLIIPFSYYENTIGIYDNESFHSILCILEKRNNVNKLYIINSHPEFKYPNNIINSIKERFKKKGVIISSYENVGCGTQTDNGQCVKYTAKLIYNYIRSNKDFDHMRPIICPGYTYDQNLTFEKDTYTDTRDSQVKYYDDIYYHLSSDDVYYMNALASN